MRISSGIEASSPKLVKQAFGSIKSLAASLGGIQNIKRSRKDFMEILSLQNNL
jgi:hypothetical protein